MPPIGFILLTHAKPEQTLRLVGRLNALFDAPPIACHHDFGKCALDTAQFPGNVSFVQPHVPTGWAEFGVVEGTLRALELLHAGGQGPEWTSILSGACYPVKPAAQILRDLRAGDYDAHLLYEPVPAPLPRSPLAEEFYRRYFKRTYQVPYLGRNGRVQKFALRLKVPLSRLPFSDSLRCFAGSQWLSLGREAALYALEFHRTQPALARTFRGLLFSEEAYFQTILANAAQFRLRNGNGWYMDWSAQQYHPKSLTLADLPAIRESAALYARKINMDTDANLMDALDMLTAAAPAARLESGCS